MDVLPHQKVKSLSDIKEFIQSVHLRGRRVGLCHGVFDLLHSGHIAHFLAAKKQVDFLIVSVTSDEFVNKGPGRPLLSNSKRMEFLSQIQCVDFVLLSETLTAVSVIEELCPDIYFKGSDYAKHDNDTTGQIISEKNAVERYGGKVHFTDEISSSSSKIIAEYFSIHSKEVTQWLKDFKQLFKLEDIFHYLNLLGNLEVDLIGEIIVDKYSEIDPLSKTSKHPILAFKPVSTACYLGGVLAIADNCAAWIKKVNVWSISSLELLNEVEFVYQIPSNVELKITNSPGVLMAKHRFIDRMTNSKLFELYEFDPEISYNLESEDLVSRFKNESQNAILIADYGHGVITNHVLDYLKSSDKYLAINVQSNAGNRGFNSLSKFFKADFFSANHGELQVEYRNRNLSLEVIIPKLMKDLCCSSALVTQGELGMKLFKENESHETPAFASKVKDRVGAGDSVFAIASLLNYVGAPTPIIGFVSNLVAAHEIQEVGHRNALTLGDIKKQIKAILA